MPGGKTVTIGTDRKLLRASRHSFRAVGIAVETHACYLGVDLAPGAVVLLNAIVHERWHMWPAVVFFQL